MFMRRSGFFMLYCSPVSPASTSGRPATLVSRDKIPASADALATITQSTSPSTAAVLIVAAAVCATVLIARTAAARIQALKFFFILFSPFESQRRNHGFVLVSDPIYLTIECLCDMPYRTHHAVMDDLRRSVHLHRLTVYRQRPTARTERKHCLLAPQRRNTRPGIPLHRRAKRLGQQSAPADTRGCFVCTARPQI